MNDRRLCILALLIAFAAIPSFVFSDSAILAGTAQCEITPPTGGPMWGYGARKEMSNGVHDPLMSKVLILKTTETTVAFVSWDVCEFQSPWLHDRTKELGIERLLLLNSHTHAGPTLDAPFPSAENPWKKTVEKRILNAIHEALDNLTPASVGAGEGSIPLCYNRLRQDPDGLATTIFGNPERIPYGPIDPTVGVIRFSNEDGSIKAVIVHYACHPVVLGGGNLKFSADYVGAMYRKVERELGGGALCLFAQGGAGNVNPLFHSRFAGDNNEENLGPVVTMGEMLAGEVLSTLDRMKQESGKSDQIRTSLKTIEVRHRWEPDTMLTFGTAAVLINDDIGIVTLPGEPFIKFQFDVREKSAIPHAYMFGYCDCTHQDWPNWYLPDVESAARGGYGASDSYIPELGTGERLVTQGLIQLYTLRGMIHDKPVPGRRGNPY